MASMKDVTVNASLANGEHVNVEGPVNSDDTVFLVAQQIAATLGVHPDEFDLLSSDGHLLSNEDIAGDACSELGTLTISVIKRPCRVKSTEYEDYILQFDEETDENEIHKAYKILRKLRFPPPQNININMMPFEMGSKESIPEEFQQYWPLIRSACQHRIGKVGYLTIQESFVQKGEIQRRGGLHVDSPTLSLTHGGEYSIQYHPWGRGVCDREKIDGGIYMCSNVSSSCRIWNARIREPEKMVGPLGDVEHLRDNLGEGRLLEANQLVWLTDTTPHESLPAEEDGFRQFFRVVASPVALWYTKHSTPNRLGFVPGVKTEIVTYDKFETAADWVSRW